MKNGPFHRGTLYNGATRCKSTCVPLGTFDNHIQRIFVSTAPQSSSPATYMGTGGVPRLSNN